MFSRSIFIAFLTLALSVQALPQRQEQCPAARTVTQLRTVTVTARGAAPTLQNGGSGNNNNGEVVKTATSAKPAATTPTRGGNGGGGNNNNNNNGSKTSSAAAVAATTAAANNANNGGKNNGNAQTSTTLDPRVIASGFANNGQDVPTAGQVASLTSTNNFINFCLTVPKLPITNGKQITTGSCNPAPIGVIPSTDNMPSSKFAFPANFGTIKAGQTFTIQMAINNMQTGFFVNAAANYFAAPQQLNAQGQIKGHSHVVIEQLSALDQTTPTDPKKFAFFKGLNAAAAGGKLTADVPDGLQAGFYKLSSINTAANHQPVIVPVAQHGSLDDAIYFTVTADGKPLAGAGGGKKNSSPAVGAAQPPPAASAATSATASATASVKGALPVKGAVSTPAPAATGKAALPNAPAASATNAPRTGNNANLNTGNKNTGNASSAPQASSTAAAKGGRRRALSRMA